MCLWCCCYCCFKYLVLWFLLLSRIVCSVIVVGRDCWYYVWYPACIPSQVLLTLHVIVKNVFLVLFWNYRLCLLACLVYLLACECKDSLCIIQYNCVLCIVYVCVLLCLLRCLCCLDSFLERWNSPFALRNYMCVFCFAVSKLFGLVRIKCCKLCVFGVSCVFASLPSVYK